MACVRAAFGLLGPALTPSHLKRIRERERRESTDSPLLHVNAALDEQIVDLSSDERKCFLHVQRRFRRCLNEADIVEVGERLAFFGRHLITR